MQLCKAGLILISLSAVLPCCSEKEIVNDPLFESLDSTSTHISFINTLQERTGELTVVDYLYYYNGAGVASGDINNDGLTDIFFVANHGRNRLYLNKGNFKFEDISANAGIEGFSDWKTGVTMADINADGYLDIYICAVGDYMGLEGSNELYINNGDNTFTEKAADYGLDFTGFSTQAAFFDYDKDGDLDMYLVTHARFLTRSFNRVLTDNLPANEALDHLFRNDNDKFLDVSEQAGIYKAQRGYGLAISVADLNNDGWDDMYVTNDFYEGDYYWINNQDGTFTESAKDHFGHQSLFSRGCDAADMNNDGYQDVMTVDISPQDEITEKTSFLTEPWDKHLYKLSFGHQDQFPRNCLQINRNGLAFSDNAFLSGVDATGYSWSPLLADYTNDGYKDIFVTNGATRRLNDLEYLTYASSDSMRYAPQLAARQIDEALKLMPMEKLQNSFYTGTEDLVFKDRSQDWGINEKTITNGASYADLDNDGDLDLITNSVNEPAGVYRNRTSQSAKVNYLTVQLRSQDKNTYGIGAKIYIKAGDKYQMQQIQTTRGFLSSVEPAAHFGIAGQKVIDTLLVVWNDKITQVLTGVEANRKLVLDHKDANDQRIDLGLYQKRSPWLVDVTREERIVYNHHENKYSEYYREKLIPFLISTEGPRVAVGDVNNDGREDFYAGGAKYQPGSLLLQDESGGFTRSQQPDFLNDSIYEDVDAAFLDVDNDKDLDLYVVTGGNEFYGKMDKQFDRLYRNDGKGNFKRDHQALPDMFDNKSCVRPFDIDSDGDLDLFVGGRVVGYAYGKSPRSYLLVNDGRGNFKDETARYCPELSQGGMITDAAWEDTDKDGDIDLIVTGDWMPVTIFENTGKLWRRTTTIVDPGSAIKNIRGLWQCLLTGDFDSDGDTDFLAGNLGLNTRFRKHGEGSELMLYYGDFDNDKKNDQILVNNASLIASREELVAQFPALQNSFKTSPEYAGKTVGELFGLLKAQPSDPLVVDQFASLYFENTGRNNFLLHALPLEVQTSKVFSMSTEDFNKDGHMDVLLGGNYNGGNLYQGNYDAARGAMLMGDGKGNFDYMDFPWSGVNFTGEVRDIKEITTVAGKRFLITKNNGPLQVLKTR